MRKLTVIFLILGLFCIQSRAENSVHLLGGLPGPVYYDSSKPMEKGDACEIAVVMIHGWGGGLSYLKEQESLEQHLPGIYVVAPRFPRKQVFDRRKIADDGRPRWNDSWSGDLTKYGNASDDWRGGGDANGYSFSSFDVVDRMFSILSDKKLYPNLKKVVLVGYSAGGQFVSRYAAVGKGKVRKGIKLDYVSMAASTYLRLDKDVPWLYGLAGMPRYCAGISTNRIMKNLSSRRVFYACGENDNVNGSTDKCPPAMLQGGGRRERMENLQKHAAAYPGWSAMLSFYIIPEIAHNAVRAYADPEFIKFVTELKD